MDPPIDDDLVRGFQTGFFDGLNEIYFNCRNHVYTFLMKGRIRKEAALLNAGLRIRIFVFSTIQTASRSATRASIHFSISSETQATARGPSLIGAGKVPSEIFS